MKKELPENVAKCEFEVARRSATGLVREENEDALCVRTERGLFAVADGMGGGDDGAKASRFVCEALQDGVTADDFTARLDQIREAIARAHRKIIDHVREKRLRQMGSTVALLAFDTANTSRATIAYVGDSRVYRLRGGQAELLTRDHSVGAELEERVGGHLGERFAQRANPLAHVLTRSVGAGANAEIEWRKVDTRPKDRFLVCTDGVHDVIETDELPVFLSDTGLEESARRLEDEVVRRGAPDNYSFILIGIGGPA